MYNLFNIDNSICDIIISQDLSDEEVNQLILEYVENDFNLRDSIIY